MQREFILVIDDEFVKASGISGEELKLEFAIWLYEKEKVSMRKASKMAGLHWLDFSKILSDRNISTVKMTDEDLKNEINIVNRLMQ